MAQTPIALTISLSPNAHTAAVRSGEIDIAGVAPQFIDVNPQIAAFRRMVRNVEFDICELAPTTHIVARALGAPYVALPIFVMRAFHHGGMLVHTDSAMTSPKDLEGKKVGVRPNQQNHYAPSYRIN